MWNPLARASGIVLALSVTISANRLFDEAPPLCSEVPLTDCNSKGQSHCIIREVHAGKKMYKWCRPRCGIPENQNEAACEPPFCTWFGTRCASWNDKALIPVPDVAVVKRPSRMIDTTPAGFVIPELECAPTTGRLVLKYLNDHYGKPAHYSIRNRWYEDEEFDRLDLNSHLLQLNGCSKCAVRDGIQNAFFDHEVHERHRHTNHVEVACVAGSCRTGYFFVSGEKSFCHPCPPECAFCEAQWWGKFKCLLNPGANLPSADCSEAKPRNSVKDRYKTRCPLQKPFYLKGPHRWIDSSGGAETTDKDGWPLVLQPRV